MANASAVEAWLFAAPRKDPRSTEPPTQVRLRPAAPSDALSGPGGLRTERRQVKD
jgi:hypothetical protein